MQIIMTPMTDTWEALSKISLLRPTLIYINHPNLLSPVTKSSYTHSKTLILMLFQDLMMI
jgi:hypothetical protein